ncbi:MAG: hypothetical protein U9P80_04530, partial [Thermodesulfobacteriota bacterium]|nr:hypothetical protein [Thermodesulfobacteriota bacterium]
MLEHFELQDLSFPLLIKDVLESHFTGILFVSHEGYKKGIIFKEGNLCAIQSNRPEELLGEVMVHLGMISQKENEESLSTARIERTKQGVILQERGVIGPQDIKNALRVQLQTRFLDIFSWEEGQVQKITKDHIDTRPGLSARELSTLV